MSDNKSLGSISVIVFTTSENTFEGTVKYPRNIKNKNEKPTYESFLLYVK